MKPRRLPNGRFVTEDRLYEAMKEIGLNPKSQYKIDQMTVDFAFPEQKLVIEVEGPHHQQEECIVKDFNRDCVLKRLGWKIKYYSAKLVFYNPEAVALRIKKELMTLGWAETQKARKILADQEKKILDNWDIGFSGWETGKLHTSRKICWDKPSSRQKASKLIKPAKPKVTVVKIPKTITPKPAPATNYNFLPFAIVGILILIFVLAPFTNVSETRTVTAPAVDTITFETTKENVDFERAKGLCNLWCEGKVSAITPVQNNEKYIADCLCANKDKYSVSNEFTKIHRTMRTVKKVIL